jgi:hypothetical protein
MLDEDQQHIGRDAISCQRQDDIFRTDVVLMRANIRCFAARKFARRCDFNTGTKIRLGGAMCSISDIQLPVKSVARWWTTLIPISRNRKSRGSRQRQAA